MKVYQKWSEEENRWLRENYPHYATSELPSMHREAFPNGPARSYQSINTRAGKLKLRKSDDYYKTPRLEWTPERIAWFMDFVPGHEEGEISAEHERVFGTPLTEGQIGNAKSKFNVKSGTHGGCFKKGQVSHNKGKTWDEMGHTEQSKANMRRSQFKKGIMPHNAVDKPVGCERVNTYGYVEVKIAERKSHPRCNDNWRMKHHIVYERHHGEIPEECNVVFADRDKRNFDPDNLVAVPRSIWSTIKRHRIPYCDAESLEVAVNIARLMSTRSAVARKVKERKCK